MDYNEVLLHIPKEILQFRCIPSTTKSPPSLSLTIKAAATAKNIRNSLDKFSLVPPQCKHALRKMAHSQSAY